MPRHPFAAPAGRIETIEIDSEALAGNRLGDPSRRRVAVYLPQGYDGSDADYPLLVDLAGFTGSGLKHVGWQAFGESVPQRLDRLRAEGQLGPVIAAFPDGFSSLGGNQYLDSPIFGRWEVFLLEELIPRLESSFRLRRGGRHRAVFGKSSGGYGALVQGMRHGREWCAVASHSGDVAFDVVYRRDLHPALDELARHGGRPERFIEQLHAARKISSDEMHVLMFLAMAASYDPDPEAPWGVRLPADPVTGELDPERWASWLRHDPLELVERPEVQASLRSLGGGLFLDCGSRDPYFLHYGTRQLVRRLEALGIEHRYEEFDDTHLGIDYRLDVSLPFLWRMLTR
jgi:enterochelin esterase-like enzyme